MNIQPFVKSLPCLKKMKNKLLRTMLVKGQEYVEIGWLSKGQDERIGSVDISFLRIKNTQKCQIFAARREKTGGVLKHAEDF